MDLWIISKLAHFWLFLWKPVTQLALSTGNDEIPDEVSHKIIVLIINYIRYFSINPDK